MKKLLFISLISLISTIANAQKYTPVVVGAGFGDFVLGADKEAFGNKIKYIDSFYWQGITDYYYTNSLDTFIDIAGVKFRSIMLTFDKFNKLVRIDLFNLYTKSKFKNPKEIASQDFKLVKTFLSKQAGKKGKTKKKFYNIVAEGCKWTNGKKLTWAYLNSNKDIKDKNKQFYDIALIWKYKDTVKIKPYKFPKE